MATNMSTAILFLKHKHTYTGTHPERCRMFHCYLYTYFYIKSICKIAEYIVSLLRYGFSTESGLQNHSEVPLLY